MFELTPIFGGQVVLSESQAFNDLVGHITSRLSHKEWATLVNYLTMSFKEFLTASGYSLEILSTFNDRRMSVAESRTLCLPYNLPPTTRGYGGSGGGGGISYGDRGFRGGSSSGGGGFQNSSSRQGGGRRFPNPPDPSKICRRCGNTGWYERECPWPHPDGGSGGGQTRASGNGAGGGRPVALPPRIDRPELQP